MHMFSLKRYKRIKKYVNDASAFLKMHYENRQDKNKSHLENKGIYIPSSDVSEYKFSLKPGGGNKDRYNVNAVNDCLQGCVDKNNFDEIDNILNDNCNQTFVEELIQYMTNRNQKSSDIYKAAQIDKRLFSKIISDREYKPSKDTALSLAFALKLTPEEAENFISRAGYTFSHSNKRDIVLEFFFREQIYNLIEINEVLFRLDLKIIGRF